MGVGQNLNSIFPLFLPGRRGGRQDGVNGGEKRGGMGEKTGEGKGGREEMRVGGGQ
jgi:hypothetical protein